MPASSVPAACPHAWARPPGTDLNADHHSTIAGPGSPPLMPQPGVPLFGSRTQVVADKTLPPPPTVLGSGGSSLPGPLARLWPTADTGKLRAAATAWQSVQSRLSSIAGDLGVAIRSITDGNDTTDAEAINHVWSKIYFPCDESTVLGALIDLCVGIAQACTEYANAVDHARHKAEAGLAAAGVVGIVYYRRGPGAHAGNRRRLRRWRRHRQPDLVCERPRPNRYRTPNGRRGARTRSTR